MFGFGKRDPNIETQLAKMAADLPNVLWLALLTSNGLLRACWPALDSRGQDRLAAMSAAILSLGERVVKELNLGNLRYGLLSGDLGQHLVVVLNSEYVLVIGLRPKASLDGLLVALQQVAPQSCLALGIRLSENWKLA